MDDFILFLSFNNPFHLTPIPGTQRQPQSKMADMPSGLHQNSRSTRPGTDGNTGGRQEGFSGSWDEGLYTPEGNGGNGDARRASATNERGGRERQGERPRRGENDAGQRREQQQRENDNSNSADSHAGKGNEDGSEDSDEEIDYYEVLDIPHNVRHPITLTHYCLNQNPSNSFSTGNSLPDPVSVPYPLPSVTPRQAAP